GRARSGRSGPAGNGLQREAEQVLEGRIGVRAERPLDGALGFGTRVPEVDQRRDDVVRGRARSDGRRFGRGKVLHLVLELDHQALGRLLADAGDAGQAGDVARTERRDELGRLDAGQHRDRELRPDARDRDQPLEERLLDGRQEAEERERVLAHVRVGEQRDLGAGLADAVAGAERDRDAVADAADVDHRLLRPLAQQPAVDLRDQRSAPTAVRRQAKQSATASASVASPGSASVSSARSRVTMKATWLFSARPKPVICCFTVAGGYSCTARPARAPASSTTPRTCPSTSAVRVLAAWNTSSTASTSGSRRSISAATPSWMCRSFSGSERRWPGASAPISIRRWRLPSVSTAP